jgi:hypothetical protein
MPTTIHFAKSDTLTVDQDINEVEGAVRQAEPGPAALATFTKRGAKVCVNVRLIRSFSEARTGSATFS